MRIEDPGFITTFFPCFFPPTPRFTLFPYTTLFRSHLLADLVAECNFPPGVLNIVQGTGPRAGAPLAAHREVRDRKSTRLNSSHVSISYAGFRLKKKNGR